MKNNSLNVPMIVIDSKNNRIRIHRNTLHLLGDPEYIQLLVNPERLMIAVLSSQKLKTANVNSVLLSYQHFLSHFFSRRHIELNEQSFRNTGSNRTRSAAKFPLLTSKGRNQLEQKLYQLQKATQIMLNALKEVH